MLVAIWWTHGVMRINKSAYIRTAILRCQTERRRFKSDVMNYKRVNLGNVEDKVRTKEKS